MEDLTAPLSILLLGLGLGAPALRPVLGKHTIWLGLLMIALSVAVGLIRVRLPIPSAEAEAIWALCGLLAFVAAGLGIRQSFREQAARSAKRVGED